MTTRPQPPRLRTRSSTPHGFGQAIQSPRTPCRLATTSHLSFPGAAPVRTSPPTRSSSRGPANASLFRRHRIVELDADPLGSRATQRDRLIACDASRAGEARRLRRQLGVVLVAVQERNALARAPSFHRDFRELARELRRRRNLGLHQVEFDSPGTIAEGVHQAIEVALLCHPASVARASDTHGPRRRGTRARG